MAKVLIISNSFRIQISLKLSLLLNGRVFLTCRSIKKAKEIMRTNKISAVLLHIHEQEENPFYFKKSIQNKYPSLSVLFLAEKAYKTIMETECPSRKDYIILPFKHTDLISTLGQHHVFDHLYIQS